MTSAQTPPRLKYRWLLFGSLLAFFIGLSLLLSHLLLEKERQRDLRIWQEKLNLIADSRQSALQSWLQDQYNTLEALAWNSSLQLYMTQLNLKTTQDSTPDKSEYAEQSYLRDLLEASANSSEFANHNTLPRSNANLPTWGSAGIALLNASGKIEVQSRAFPAQPSPVAELIRLAQQSGKRHLSKPYLNHKEQLSLAFIVPVQALQGGHAQPIAYLLGIQPIAAALQENLQQQGLSNSSQENLLLIKEVNHLTYLNQHRNSAALQRRINRNQNIAAAQAAKQTGKFIQNLDYAGQEVLLTSRPILHTAWILISKINRNEALQESLSRQRFLSGLLILLFISVGLGLLAAWRHGTSRRYQQLNLQLNQQSSKLQDQQQLLHSITDNVSDCIALIDSQQRLIFVNKALAQKLDSQAEQLHGKTLHDTFGPYTSKRLEQASKQAQTQQKPYSLRHNLEIAGKTGIYHSTFRHLTPTDNSEAVTLCVAHDLTQIMAAENQQQQMLSQLINTLTKVLETHDPYSVKHAERVTEVADQLAQQLNLDQQQQQTVHLAASLINVGKFYLPQEVLNKKEPLTLDERQQVQQHLQHTQNLLQEINFTSPVLQTIQQSFERLDGSGYPDALTNKQIQIEGRILAVANSLIAMVQPRPWREALNKQTAINNLLKENEKYDRKVVAALLNFAENHAPADWLQE
ncbi:MAG: HD domain-containing phosphohydrolase [Gammaproteobacteria bacterium]|nr:HD domain-containing phosphohydrolase [Gammaproteobacteria bacterium]